MKQLLFTSICFLFIISCKKEIGQKSDSFSFFDTIVEQLKDSVSATDFQQLDLDHSVVDNLPLNNARYLRIPFLNNSIQTDFILLKVEKNNLFSSGKIIHISSNHLSISSKKATEFNGEITINSLNRNSHISSVINNGYVTALHPKRDSATAKDDVVEIPTLPEVVVMCYIRPDGSGGGYSYSDYYNLGSLLGSGSGSSGSGDGAGGAGSFTGNGDGNSGGYYSNSSPNNSGGSNGKVVKKVGGRDLDANEDIKFIDFEPVENLDAINMDQYVKCFGNIPDAGATCSIKLLTDIPVDSDPSVFFDWTNESPGHTFLQLTKTNGTQTVQQNIGFYPVQGWKTILALPVDGKFVDNADHEFNASFSVNIGADKFQNTLIYMQNLSKFVKYDIDDYNCTNFALDVFNYQQDGKQLTIPLYDIPGGNTPNGSATPQGVYQKLLQMKNAGGADAANITIPGYKGFAGNSNGPCN